MGTTENRAGVPSRSELDKPFWGANWTSISHSPRCERERLASAKLCLALFHERLSSLQRIRASPHLGLRLDLATELCGVGRVFAFLEQHAGGDQRAGRPLGEAPRQRHRLVQQTVVVD